MQGRSNLSYEDLNIIPIQYFINAAAGLKRIIVNPVSMKRGIFFKSSLIYSPKKLTTPAQESAPPCAATSWQGRSQKSIANQ
jgi:hypothetical protein